MFFQTVLLAGYALTHLMTTRGAARRFGLWQLGLLLSGAALLPLHLRKIGDVPATGSPSLWLIGTLTISVGLLYLGLATTSPFVQNAFARSGHPRSSDPYFLYAASNVGSLVGLLSYPLLIEPRFGLHRQLQSWGVAYLLFVLCVVAIVVLDRSAFSTFDVQSIDIQSTEDRSKADQLMPDRSIADRTSSLHVRDLRVVGAETAIAISPTSQWVRWIALAAVPAAVSLAATNYLTTEVAQLPLLWVLCLSMYLLSFIVAFSRRCPSVRFANAFAGCCVGAAIAASFVVGSVRTNVTLQLLAVFGCGLAYHGRIAKSRPPVGRLTGFYVAIAIGGIIGSAINVFGAPLMLVRPIEYSLLLCVATVGLFGSRGKVVSRYVEYLLAPIVGYIAVVIVRGARKNEMFPAWAKSGTFLIGVVAIVIGMLIWKRRSVVATAIVFAVALMSFRDSTIGSTLFRRSFYGALHVDEVAGIRRLVHGTTTHGYQFLDPSRAAVATSYYAATGPLGRVILERASDDSKPKRYGVIGLGTGTIASYLEANDHLTYFEIDKTIVDIATDPKLFTFVSAHRNQVDIVVGDGRRELERSTEKFDVLVVDAFNSDSIPTHLLTKEALSLYGAHLRRNGVVAIHVSNRYLELGPVVGATARLLHLASISGHYVPSDEEVADGAGASDWVFVAKLPSTLAPLRAFDGFAPTELSANVRGWTDDRVDIASSLTL